METTLEVRWFIEGIPSVEVQNWFENKCPGKLLGQPEIRKDRYFCGDRDLIEQYVEIPAFYSSEEINLKLRSEKLELKLRQKQLGIAKFASWEGKIEQWCKLSQRELKQLLISDPKEQYWIKVIKEREQKIAQNVKSELTRLSVDRNWWSLAFEMPQEDNNRQLAHFRQIVDHCALSALDTLELSLQNSYSYSHWIKKLS
jgi:hypothetical protein